MKNPEASKGTGVAYMYGAESRIWKYFNRIPWKETARDRQEWTTHLEKFAYLNAA